MQLGSSLRRRRRGSKESSKRSGEDRRLSPRSRRTLVGLGVVAVGFGLGWIVSTQALFPAPPPPGDLFEVPNLRGATVEEARSSLEEAGLALGAVGRFRHPRADSGSVVGQSPLPGQLARPGDSVALEVSLGPEMRAVPDVARLRREEAVTVLEEAGFVVTVDTVQALLARNRVVSQAPAGGVRLATPGEVSLVVSTGPPEVAVPQLRGMTEGEARDTLSALGLVVSDVEEVFRFGGNQGVVVDQSPEAETVLEVGRTVRLVVGRRREEAFLDPRSGAP